MIAAESADEVLNKTRGETTFALKVDPFRSARTRKNGPAPDDKVKKRKKTSFDAMSGPVWHAARAPRERSFVTPLYESKGTGPPTWGQAKTRACPRPGLKGPVSRHVTVFRIRQASRPRERERELLQW